MRFEVPWVVIGLSCVAGALYPDTLVTKCGMAVVAMLLYAVMSARSTES